VTANSNRLLPVPARRADAGVTEGIVALLVENRVGKDAHRADFEQDARGRNDG
jgi:hypothetical protein